MALSEQVQVARLLAPEAEMQVIVVSFMLFSIYRPMTSLKKGLLRVFMKRSRGMSMRIQGFLRI